MHCVLAIAMLLSFVASGQEDTTSIRSITVEQAQALAHGQDLLNLSGLTTLSEEAANALANHKKLLSLGGVTELSGVAENALRRNGKLPSK